MNYIISKHTSKVYNYHPQTKDELKKLINKLIKERGNKANLNDIDTSAVKDMSFLFNNLQFNGDISYWNVSNVTNMSCMFAHSKFTGENGDISNWNVSNVKNMNGMFYDSKFNGNISKWNVSNVLKMDGMFRPLKMNQI